MSEQPGVRSGEIWFAWLDPVIGHDQGGRRPVLVVSSNLLHEISSALVFAVPLTTRNRGVRSHVPVVLADGALPRDSLAMTEQLRSISRERLSQRIAAADEATMKEIRKQVAWFLDLG